MTFVKKFYLGDTHFSHAAIITHCDRPFRSVGVMDETMIRSWNEVVGPADLVFHLGDFSLGLQDAERVAWIFQRLNGRKVLILGNHDLDRKGRVHPTLAALDWETITPAMETNDNGQRVYLHHYACRTWPAAHHGSFHFFGHSHGNLPPLGRSRDVGVDVPDVDFRPRTFHELTENMSKETV